MKRLTLEDFEDWIDNFDINKLEKIMRAVYPDSFMPYYHLYYDGQQFELSLELMGQKLSAKNKYDRVYDQINQKQWHEFCEGMKSWTNR